MLHLIGECEDSLLFPVPYNFIDVSNPIFNKAVKGPWHHRWSSSRRRGLMRTNMHGRDGMTVQGRSLFLCKVIFLHYTETLSGMTIKSFKKKKHTNTKKKSNLWQVRLNMMPCPQDDHLQTSPCFDSLEGQNDDGKTKLVSDLIFWQKNIHLGTYLEDFLARWNEEGICPMG